MNARNKKLYLTIAGVAVAALAVDKLMLQDSISSPQNAQGAEATTGFPAVNTSPSLASGMSGTPIPELPFPRSLPPFDPRIDKRNLFAMPEEIRMRIRPDKPESDSPARGQGKSGSAAQTFEGRHRLNAVFSFGGDRSAVVDGHRLRLGDIWGGCELVDIVMSKRSVVFECAGGMRSTLTSFPITGENEEKNPSTLRQRMNDDDTPASEGNARPNGSEDP